MIRKKKIMIQNQRLKKAGVKMQPENGSIRTGMYMIRLRKNKKSIRKNKIMVKRKKFMIKKQKKAGVKMQPVNGLILQEIWDGDK